MRTKTIPVVDRSSTVSGPSTPQFVTLPAAPWEASDREHIPKSIHVGSKIEIFGKMFVSVTRAAKDLKVDRTSLLNAYAFGKLDQYVAGHLAKEKSGARPYKTFATLYDKLQKRDGGASA